MNYRKSIITLIVVVCCALVGCSIIFIAMNQQYGPNHGRSYVQDEYRSAPYPPAQYRLDPRQRNNISYDPYGVLNTTYIHPYHSQYHNHNHSNVSHDLQNQSDNNNNINPDRAVAQLLQLRHRPGNPRVRQRTINKYGTFSSTEAPNFPADHFIYAKYGQDDSDDLFKGWFKNADTKPKVSDIKLWMGIDDVDIQSLAVSQRISFDKNITDNYSGIQEIFPDDNPIPQSAKDNDTESIKAIIEEAINSNMSPEEFRLQHAMIARNQSNRIWFKNLYDAKKKEKKAEEDIVAVEWLRGQLTQMQLQVINKIKQTHHAYTNKYETDSKKILMGNRKVGIIVNPGNKGLTTTFKFIQMEMGTDKVMLLSSAGKTSDVLCNYTNQLNTVTDLELLLWNIPRDGWEKFRWDSVEQICDGIATADKYLSNTLVSPPPSMFIATNKMFNLKCEKSGMPYITLDRLKVYRVRQSVSALEEIDIFEYYLAKYGDNLRVNEEEEHSDFDLADL